jgi:phospholipase C
VSPPAIPQADVRSDGIRWFGPRVPAWLISPYAPKAGRIKQQFDHCSILKFLADWLGVEAPGRAKSANTASIADALLDAPRAEAPPQPPAPPPQPAAITPGMEPPASEVERAAVAFLDSLEAEDPAIYQELQQNLSR